MQETVKPIKSLITKVVLKKMIEGFSLADIKTYYKMRLINIIRLGKETQVGLTNLTDFVLQISW